MKKVLNLIISGVFGTALIWACTNENSSSANVVETTETPVQQTQENRVNVDNWPETAQKAAKAMKEKYGEPAESTPSMLIWHNTGPFTHTIVYKEEVQHDFPMPHKDVLEQFINYKVPADKFDELAMYDGSVIAERTKGVMSARCDKEGANILALNLANDIVNNKRTVDEARKFYADAMMQMMQGEKPAYITSLQFSAANGNVGDSDKTIMDMSKVKQMKQN
jgi:hypothetical protein